MRWINDLPIRVKAFAASAVLLMCLVGLGSNAFATLTRWARGLDQLSLTTLPEQQRLRNLRDRVSAVQLNVFRYVAWSNNSIGGRLLNELRTHISGDADLVSGELDALADQATAEERERWQALTADWKRFLQTARDTIDIAGADPPMGTMMLGGTDDDFQRVAGALRGLSDVVDQRARTATQALAIEAEHSKRLLAIGGLLGVLLSLGVTILASRSIVNPIRAVTSTMKRVARGEPVGNSSYEERRDEIGQMLDAISTFRDKIESDNAVLNERDRELHLQNARFEAALNNMTHGLAMFDGHGELIVCNRRYAQIYGLPAKLTKPGTSQDEVLSYLLEGGLCADAAVRNVGDGAARARSGTPGISHLDLSDGRCVVVARQPMADGGWLSMHEDVTERRRVEAQMERMARYDALTDLPNRVLFKEKLEEAAARARRGETIAVLCLDLDHFKEVNDTLGHPVGDILLKSVSARLRSCVRELDTVARLSGDEFAIIQVGIESAESASVLAQRVVDVVTTAFDLDGHQVVIGTSVGISVGPTDGTDAEKLLKCADTALYRAKGEGRGMYRFFESGMDDRLQARRAMELALRAALSQSQFELHYQPIVNLRDKQVTGFEALLRWHHPDRGLISPDEFIPLAEEIGIIIPIGEWVLRQACAEAATWPPQCKVAINISPAQFRSPNLVPVVVRALAESGLAPGRLELEITESVLIENTEAVSATLHQLHVLGVRISMDDFGTGYSSLSYLHKFPFDKIKIDASFVRNLGQSEESVAIVRAVAGLGKSLGIATTAEGVETQEQLDSVTAEGCDEGQGYFFSVPRPAKDIEVFIAEFVKRAAA